MLQDTETGNAESFSQEEEMEHGQIVKKQKKRERLEDFRSFRTSKRQKRRSEQRSNKEEDVETQNF